MEETGIYSFTLLPKEFRLLSICDISTRPSFQDSFVMVCGGRVSRNYRLVMPVRIGAIFRRVAQSSTLARVPAGLQKSSLARPLRGCERFKGAILRLECRHAIVLAYDYS